MWLMPVHVTFPFQESLASVTMLSLLLLALVCPVEEVCWNKNDEGRGFCLHVLIMQELCYVIIIYCNM